MRNQIMTIVVAAVLSGCSAAAPVQSPQAEQRENMAAGFAASREAGRLRALTEPKEWMKKENPKELRAILDLAGQSTSRCPSRHQHYQEVVDAVLVGSGVEPASESGPNNDFYIVVQLICQDLAPQPDYSFTLTTHFGRVVGTEVGGVVGLEAMLFADRQKTATGVGSDDDIVSALRNITEEVVADYVQANFDL